MDIETLKRTIRQELPELLRRDPEFRSYVMQITRGEFADQIDTRDRFHETLEEMRRESEKQDRKWDLWLARCDKRAEEDAQKWSKHAED